MSASCPPKIESTQEVRFAVVMYGGVSLAIYINGITQELLRMVRSTANAAKDSQGKPVALSSEQTAQPQNTLTGTERVYRKLSYLLSDETLLSECRTLSEPKSDKGESFTELKEKLENLLGQDRKTITTRFIVDILSGTSAGGINSIFLAKALANDQRIDRLKQLWINEGDIRLLLNDAESFQGTNLLPQDRPQSLLNSRRMYLKLLKAFDDMERDKPRGKEFISPYTEELDLFITATDIEGVPVPLKLSDMIVYERRHRNVFHFEYQQAEGHNDFVSDSNPFLAFAARCTSSFPFAFEPMRLCDIDEVLEILPDYRDNKDCKSDSPKWRHFFKEVLDPRTGEPNLRFARRSFGDGGYLDNKPFSYAITTLGRRQSDVLVDRKLIYIEPSPEHPEDTPERDHKPDALANVKTALLDLPSYETVREDLQRILERNNLIERVQRIISGIERDVNNYLPRELITALIQFRQATAADEASAPQQTSPTEEAGPVIPARTAAEATSSSRPEAEIRSGSGQAAETGAAASQGTEEAGKKWSDRTLSEMVEQNGRYFLSYRRLRISAVTDEIARLVARLLDFDTSSDLVLSLRCLIRAWREKTYHDYDKPTVNEFLWDYDYSYRVRRLSFVRQRIDKLCECGASLLEDLEDFRKKSEEVQALRTILELRDDELKSFRNRYPRIGWLLGLLTSGATLSKLDPAGREELRRIMLFLKCEVNEVYKDIQSQGRLLRQRGSKLKESEGAAPTSNPVFEPIANIGITPEHLKSLLGLTAENKPSDNRQAGKNDPALDEEDCYRRAVVFFDKHSGEDAIGGKLKKASEALKGALTQTFQDARSRCEALFDPNMEIKARSERGQDLYQVLKNPLESDIFKAAREHLNYYYHNFDDYDQIRFPIFYDADVGEADVVEVIRISPEDATSLIDERAERGTSPDGKGRQKLAGVALHHFGAFLDRTWRQNDIMWGRLDGTERLITALLPGPQDGVIRSTLIEEAHTAILIDELPPESRLQLGGLVSEALMRASAGEPVEQAITKVTKHLKDQSPVRTRLEKIIRASLDNKELLEFIRRGYEVNRQLDPKPLLTSISRSTQIIGKVFEDIANANQLDGKSLSWIARLGQMFWGLVEIAVPNSIKNMLWNHWLRVIYAFELFTIVAGLLFSSQGAQQFGWTAFGITAVLNILVLILKDIMRGRQAVFRATGFLVCLLILALSTLGLLEVLGPIFDVRWGPDPGLHPMFWLKESIKGELPQEGWLGRNFITLLVLAASALVLLLLNGIFGLVNFSWLERRWQLWRKWLNKSKLRRFLPWGTFKPIKFFGDGIEEKTRPFPGKEDLYLMPFPLSATPPRQWVDFFDENFRRERGSTPNHGFTISNQEILVLASSTALGGIVPRLKAAVEWANKEHQSVLEQQAAQDYENQKRLMNFPDGSTTQNSSNSTLKIRAELETIRKSAPTEIGKWGNGLARVLGLLTCLMAVAVLATLLMNYRQMQIHTNANLPAGLHAPGIALQLVRSPEEVDQIVRTQCVLSACPDNSPVNVAEQGKNQLRKNIQSDWFIIVYYTLTLGLVCFSLARRNRAGFARKLAILAGLCVLIAATGDVVENFRILTVLKQAPPTLDTVNGIYDAAGTKWGALFLCMGFLGVFFSIHRQSRLKLIAIPLLLTTAAGLLGVFYYRAAVEWAFFLMSAALLFVGLLFLLSPQKLKTG